MGVSYTQMPDSARDSAWGHAATMNDLSPLDQMELEHERNRDDVAAIRAGMVFEEEKAANKARRKS